MFYDYNGSLCVFAEHAICYRPSVCRPSVRLSVTRVDQSETIMKLGLKIMQPSPQSSPVPLVFAV